MSWDSEDEDERRPRVSAAILAQRRQSLGLAPQVRFGFGSDGSEAGNWKPPERIQRRSAPPPQQMAAGFTAGGRCATAQPRPAVGFSAGGRLISDSTPSLRRQGTSSLGGSFRRKPKATPEVINTTFANNGAKAVDRRKSCMIQSGVSKKSRFLHSQGTVSNLMSDAAMSFKGERGHIEKARYHMEVAQTRARLRSISRRTIDPRSKFVRVWDVVMISALAFTAFVTPFHVAVRSAAHPSYSSIPFHTLLYPSTHEAVSVLISPARTIQFIEFHVSIWDAPIDFTLNRIVDAIFAFDMLITFFLPFRESAKKGGMMVYDNRRIVRNYLRGWFLVDLFTCVPFDSVFTGIAQSARWETRGETDGKLLRLLRMLRVLKLARIVRASRILARWQDHISLPFAIFSLIKFGAITATLAHWLACYWGFLADTSRLDDGWTALDGAISWRQRSGVPADASAFQLYGICIYVALNNIFGGGCEIYASTYVELAAQSLMIFFGSSVWAYIIGSACGIVATLDPARAEYRQTMDQVTEYCRSELMPHSLTVRLRSFFRNTMGRIRATHYEKLLRLMSVRLRGDAAYARAAWWLRSVPFLVRPDLEPEFMCTLAIRFVTSAYSRLEHLSCRILFVVERGLVARAGVLGLVGACFGKDVILVNEALRDFGDAIALTFVQTISLTQKDIFELLPEYPMAYHIVRKAALRMALCRAMIKAAKMHRRLAAQGRMHDILDVFDAAMLEAIDRTASEALLESRKKDVYIPISLGSKPPTEVEAREKKNARAAVEACDDDMSGGDGSQSFKSGTSGDGSSFKAAASSVHTGTSGRRRRRRTTKVFLEKSDLKKKSNEEVLRELSAQVSADQRRLVRRLEAVEAATKADAEMMLANDTLVDRHTELLERIVRRLEGRPERRLNMEEMLRTMRIRQPHRKQRMGASAPGTSAGGGGGHTSSPARAEVAAPLGPTQQASAATPASVSASPQVGKPPPVAAARRRAGVSAKSSEEETAWEGSMKRRVKAAAGVKTPDQRAMIKSATSSSPLFESLSPTQLEEVIDAMQEESKADDEIVISQGEVGEFFYVVASGEFSVFLRQVEEGTKCVKVYRVGGTFGELALMYNQPRAATVRCSAAGTLWSLERVTFRAILTTANRQRIEGIAAFLRECVVFAPLTDAQRTALGDVLTEVTVAAGEQVCAQGEACEAVHLVREGTLVELRHGQLGGVVEEETRYGPHASFGDVALNRADAVHAGSVVATEQSMLLRLSRAHFTELFGDSLSSIGRTNFTQRMIGQITFFRELSPEDRELLVDELRETGPFPEGANVIEQGSTGDALYIVKSGGVHVWLQDEHGERTIVKERLGPGDYFGEMALLKEGTTRRATVTATEPTVCMTLDRTMFRTLLGERVAHSIIEREAARRAVEMERSRQERVVLADLEILSVLGVGTYGRVKLAVHKSSRTPYALKCIRKGNVIMAHLAEQALAEKELQAECDHPFILRLVDTFQDDLELYMVLELALGGELFSELRTKGKFAERAAAFYTASVGSALEHMHGLRIIFRDVKPENLLLDGRGYIKVVDFGFAKKLEEGGCAFTLCGTPEYLAPEIIMSKGHSYGVDWWAVGILTYEMLCSKPPFAESIDPMELYKRILANRVTYPAHLSGSSLAMRKGARDFVSRLLASKPTQRLGCLKGGSNDVFEHPWLKGLVDMEALLKRALPAPVVPRIKSPTDTSNFAACEEADKTDADEHWIKYKKKEVFESW